MHLSLLERPTITLCDIITCKHNVRKVPDIFHLHVYLHLNHRTPKSKYLFNTIYGIEIINKNVILYSHTIGLHFSFVAFKISSDLIVWLDIDEFESELLES